MNHPDQGGQDAGRPRGLGPRHPEDPGDPGPGLNHAEQVIDRLRRESLNERIRAGMPDANGPHDLPDGSGWRLILEDGSVLTVFAESHDCPKEAFLQDPITEHYGVGAEMLHLITCKHCEAEEAAR